MPKFAALAAARSPAVARRARTGPTRVAYSPRRADESPLRGSAGANRHAPVMTVKGGRKSTESVQAKRNVRRLKPNVDSSGRSPNGRACRRRGAYRFLCSGGSWRSRTNEDNLTSSDDDERVLANTRDDAGPDPPEAEALTNERLVEFVVCLSVWHFVCKESRAVQRFSWSIDDVEASRPI
jgi:hypothetical protein